MEAMSEILLDGLAQEQIHEPLDEPLDSKASRRLVDKPLTNPLMPLRPLRSPGNVQAPASDN